MSFFQMMFLDLSFLQAFGKLLFPFFIVFIVETRRNWNG
jgi:hypothetical protein